MSWHRIIGSDGSLGGFTGGLEMKKRLLSLEGIKVPKQGKINRKKTNNQVDD
ncbi:MAG: MGMT family protein [Dehalobacterium sp.]